MFVCLCMCVCVCKHYGTSNQDSIELKVSSPLLTYSPGRDRTIRHKSIYTPILSFNILQENICWQSDKSLGHFATFGCSNANMLENIWETLLKSED